ncbi:hypothetical protein [uncultured Gammaproteobacteria bacterium]|nr:hypothetical protein [uncultured Gammaproteobacteria bacterium]CAC9620282.1 hypothetical protein [uncultured Gammaproteobacteria bacterium]
MLDDDVNPSTHKHIQKNKLSKTKLLSEVALEWYAKRYQTGIYKESKAVFWRLEKYLFPALGEVPIQQIEPPMIFNMVEQIQESGFVETGQCVNSY